MAHARTSTVLPLASHRAAASLLALAVATAAAPRASAQAGAPAPAAPHVASLREEILGYDPARGVLAYVEHGPSPLAGFSHVTVVELAPGAPPRRIRLTTDEDVNQCRATRDASVATRTAIEARVARDLDAIRARYQQGAVVPVSEHAPAGGACRIAPFAPREFALEQGPAVRVTVAPDGTRSTVALVAGERVGAATEVPAVTLTSGTTTIRAPYDRVADARELPGTDAIAVLLRSDACTPEGARVPAIAVLVAAPPPPERPLAALPHAELSEAAVIHALARRARRRTLDEVSGWFEGRTRVVFDNAWTLPSPGGERILVQYSRHDPDLSPLLADAGQAGARFALISREGGRLRVVAQLAPPAQENVFEGTGQEAYEADLDGDGRPEVVVRSRLRADGEVATVLRWTESDLQFIWRGTTGLDERAAPTGAQAEVRRCTLGLDGQTLVSRCQVEMHRPNAAPDAMPLSRARLVQRIRWNGGALQITQERR
jgi:hypothetical protein